MFEEFARCMEILAKMWDDIPIERTETFSGSTNKRCYFKKLDNTFYFNLDNWGYSVSTIWSRVYLDDPKKIEDAVHTLLTELTEMKTLRHADRWS